MSFYRSLFLIIISFIPILSGAFSPGTTHPAITSQGIDFYNNFSEQKITGSKVSWMVQGSMEEDSDTRSLYHFYDPVNNRGIKGSMSAKLWAQYSGNEFSWQKAKEAYFIGDDKTVYLILGHITHLIQDMFVPDHTRNDSHLPLDESVFEVWAGENRNEETLKGLSDSVLSLGLSPKIFGSLDEYFDFSASYSNGNFFSKDTIEDKNYDNPVVKRYEDKLAYGDDNLYLDEHVLLKTKANEEGVLYKFLYNIKDGDTSVVSDYFSRLSKQAIIVQAGVMKLFFEEAEKYKLEQQKIQTEQKVDSKLFLLIKGIRKSLASGFYFMIDVSKTSNLATVSESLNFSQNIQSISVSVDSSGEATFFTNQAESNNEESEHLQVDSQNNILDQELEDMVGVKKEDLLEALRIVIEEANKKDKISTDTQNDFSFYFSGGGGGVSLVQDNDEEEDISTTTATSSLHNISLISPNNFSDYFFTNDLEFSGTSTPDSVISNSYSNSTTTANEKGEWSLTQNFDEGTSTIFFTSTFEDKIATTSEYKIKIHLLPEAPTITNSSCVLSFVDSKCVLATTTFSISWGSENIGTTTYSLSFQDSTSTTTSTTSEYTNLTEGEHKIIVSVLDDMGFSSATTSLDFEIISQPVVINEISWVGEASSSDEWIELYNRTNYEIDLSNWSLYSNDLSPNILLVGKILPKDYYLIEHKLSKAKNEETESPIKNIQADLWASFSYGLKNSGEELTLSYKKIQNGTTTEMVSDHLDLCDNWCGYGGGTKHLSMERWNADLPSNWADGFGGSNWGSNIEIVRNGLNKNDGEIYGTPKKKNSISYKPVNNNYFVGDLTLTKEKSPYLIFGSLFIDGIDSNLKIEDGVVVKFADASAIDESYISSYGKVLIEGTADSKVIFTSIYDRDAGEDLVMASTSNSTPIQIKGGLYVFDQLRESEIKNTVFKYMKQSVSVYNSPLSIEDSTFDNGNGLWIFGADIKVIDTFFKNILDNPLGIFEDGGKSGFFTGRDITIDGGSGMFGIGIDGYDSNINGVNIKGISGSYGMNIQDSNSVLSNVKIEKDFGVALNLLGGKYEIYDSNFDGQGFSGTGIVASGDNFSLKNIKVNDFDHGLVFVDGLTNILNSEIKQNIVGIEINSGVGNAKIFGNSIVDNTEYGLSNLSGIILDAKGNWWGDTSGPNDGSEEYFGIGDYINGDIDYLEFLASNPFSLCLE
jgi:hypothetical protein